MFYFVLSFWSLYDWHDYMSECTWYCDRCLALLWLVSKVVLDCIDSVTSNSVCCLPIQKDIKLSPENSFAQQVVAEETGHVTVSLLVRAKDGSSLQISGTALRDDIQIQVLQSYAVV